MAGFAIDLGDEGSQFAQGVSAPSANASAAAAQGLQNITQGLFGVADSFARASAKSAPRRPASIGKPLVPLLDNLTILRVSQTQQQYDHVLILQSLPMSPKAFQ